MTARLTPLTTPVYPEMATHPLWRHFYGHYKGVSLIREGGVWSEIEYADADRIEAADVFLQGGLEHEFNSGTNLMVTHSTFTEPGGLRFEDYADGSTYQKVTSDGDGDSACLEIHQIPSFGRFWYTTPTTEVAGAAAIQQYAAPVQGSTLYTISISAKRVDYVQASDDGFYFGVLGFQSNGLAVVDYASRQPGSAGRGQSPVSPPFDATSAPYCDYLVNGELDPATNPDVWNRYSFPYMTTPSERFVVFEIGNSNRESGWTGNTLATWRFDNLSVSDGVGADPYLTELLALGYEVV